MKPSLRIALSCVLATLLVGCATTPRRQVVSASALRKGAVAAAAPEPGQVPSQTTTVWNSGDLTHGCDITISYHGEAGCDAHLEYVSPADAPSHPLPDVPSASPSTNTIVFPMSRPLNPYSSRRAEGDNITITLQNVTEVRLVCGDSVHSHPGECAYVIRNIDCSRNSQQVYLARKAATSLARLQVAAPTARQVVWSAPVVGGKAKLCNVTALLRGSKFCNARVWTSGAMGNATGFEFAREEAGFVTFHNISKLELECGSTADTATGDCLVEVVQTEYNR